MSVSPKHNPWAVHLCDRRNSHQPACLEDHVFQWIFSDQRNENNEESQDYADETTHGNGQGQWIHEAFPAEDILNFITFWQTVLYFSYWKIDNAMTDLDERTSIKIVFLPRLT